MPTWAWIVIAVVVVLVIVALVAAAIARRRRTAGLREHFGPEYDRTLEQRDGRRQAEADLRNRQKEREHLNITPLSDAARTRYAEQWRELQERFVDQPASVVTGADELVRRVMDDEGYPVDDFNSQAELISVDHPELVQNYRTAHGVWERTQRQQATTEDMRTALLSYRSLFDELLGADAGDGRHSSDQVDEEQQGL